MCRRGRSRIANEAPPDKLRAECARDTEAASPCLGSLNMLYSSIRSGLDRAWPPRRLAWRRNAGGGRSPRRPGPLSGTRRAAGGIDYFRTLGREGELPEQGPNPRGGHLSSSARSAG